MNLVDRLEANSTWEPNSGCRLWLGALNREHGVIKVGGKSDQVHRVAWEIERGPIPKGLWVLHNCGVGPCFNVNHLRLGTRTENTLDLNRPGGYTWGRTGMPTSRVPIHSAPDRRRPKALDAEISHAEVRRIMAYDPETGILRWRVRADRDHSWNMRFSGEEAGAVLTLGYRYINFNKRLHPAHRIAWLWMTGDWPKDDIDHINGDRADNRWANLRAATQMQNSANQKVRSTNTSGTKGVCWIAKKGRWRASIMVAGKTIYLGYFSALDDAIAARKAAETEHHGVFAHIRGNA